MSEMQQEAGQMRELLRELQDLSGFKPGNLIVFGSSSSEVLGQRIGKGTNLEVPEAILPVILSWAKEHGLFVAVQGCEHIDRCLVVEAACAEKYDLEIVNVVPHQKAGGGFATVAMELFEQPVVVLNLRGKAHGGVDTGNTFIGMHMRRVVVPVRLSVKKIGEAAVSCARTRPMLVGGERARYYSC